VLDFFKQPSGTLASPPVLVKAGDEDPDAPPTFQEKIVIRFLFSFCKFFIFKTYKHIVWNHPPHFSIVFMETSVSANIAHLRTTYDVTFVDDCTLELKMTVTDNIAFEYRHS